MKGRKIFTETEIAELKRLIILRNKTAPSAQKAIRQKMRNIGFYGKDDWGINDLQLSDLETLINSGRITISKGTHKPTAKPEIVSTTSVKPITKTSATVDITKLKTQLETARLKYRPDNLKYLLIAEAPPDSVERFFYYDDVREHDYLFLGVAQALYPELKDKFLASKRSSVIKNEILRKFQADGFYLLDLSELPLSQLTDDLSFQLVTLIEKVKNVADEQTKIILIKVNVYDIAFNSLQEEFENVVDIRITFPLYKGLKLFPLMFDKALKLVGYR
jgi:hypothetical protein